MVALLAVMEERMVVSVAADGGSKGSRIVAVRKRMVAFL